MSWNARTYDAMRSDLIGSLAEVACVLDSTDAAAIADKVLKTLTKDLIVLV